MHSSVSTRGKLKRLMEEISASLRCFMVMESQSITGSSTSFPPFVSYICIFQLIRATLVIMADTSIL